MALEHLITRGLGYEPISFLITQGLGGVGAPVGGGGTRERCRHIILPHGLYADVRDPYELARLLTEYVTRPEPAEPPAEPPPERAEPALQVAFPPSAPDTRWLAYLDAQLDYAHAMAAAEFAALASQHARVVEEAVARREAARILAEDDDAIAAILMMVV